MGDIVLAGSTSGTTTLTPTAVSGTTTLTLPATSGTITTKDTNGILSVNGVQFPATQSASADANCLDDYEEGTWTPTLTGSSGGSATYNAQAGTYVKVGSMVTLNFWIYGSSVNTLSGTVTITLPFTVTAINSVRPAALMLPTSLTLTGQLGGWVDSGSTSFSLQVSNNGAKTNLNATAIPASVFEMYGSISYRASA